MNKFEIKCKEKTLKSLELKRDKHLKEIKRYEDISINEFKKNGLTRKVKRTFNAALRHGEKFTKYSNIIESYILMELAKLD